MKNLKDFENITDNKFCIGFEFKGKKNKYVCEPFYFLFGVSGDEFLKLIDELGQDFNDEDDVVIKLHINIEKEDYQKEYITTVKFKDISNENVLESIYRKTDKRINEYAE